MQTSSAFDSADHPDFGVGRDIRALRKARSMTLAELALAIGRSLGFVSQLERGLSSPSIADLRAIAKLFDVPVGFFFGTPTRTDGEAAHIVRASRRRTLGTEESGIVEELLSPDLGGSFEMFRSQFAPGARLDEPVMRDTEEAGYVVSGTLDLEIDGTPYRLEAGDSFRFERKPYRWTNPGEAPCVVIWTVSPPIY